MCSYVSEAHSYVSEARMTAKDFREYAEEHLGWAKTARSTKERQTFLQMAQAWLEAADMWKAAYGVEPTANAQSSAGIYTNPWEEPRGPNPVFVRQVVTYPTHERPGTIII